MQTLKTAVVVILLLVVFYGVYEVLTRPPADPADERAMLADQAIAPPEIKFGAPTDPVVSMPSSSASHSPPSAMGDVSPVPKLPGESNSSSGSGMPMGSAPERSPVALMPPPAHFANAPTLPSVIQDSSMSATKAGEHEGHGKHGERGGTPPQAAPAATPSPSSIGVMDPNSPKLLQNPYVDQAAVGTPPVKPQGDKSVGEQAYKSALRRAKKTVKDQNYHDALYALSAFYKSQDLTEQQQRELLDLLDPLAGEVVYSKKHLVMAPHKVRRNETLMEIAKQYNVPWQLLQKINGIKDPRVLLPGADLKVVSGPFHAEVDLKSNELTVFLGQLYAGRFPITIAGDPPPMAGEYEIRDKRENRTYFAADGRQIPGGSPRNPFGKVWLDLGKEICIHGSPSSGSDSAAGCISLSPRDAGDVYSILSVGSRVRILR